MSGPFEGIVTPLAQGSPDGKFPWSTCGISAKSNPEVEPSLAPAGWVRSKRPCRFVVKCCGAKLTDIVAELAPAAKTACRDGIAPCWKSLP